MTVVKMSKPPQKHFIKKQENYKFEILINI